MDKIEETFTSAAEASVKPCAPANMSGGGLLNSSGLALENALCADTPTSKIKSVSSPAPRLSASQLRVLGAIAAVGGVSLTKDRLAELAGCSKKTVDRAVSRFVREGLVKVRPHYAANGGQLANEYVIVPFAARLSRPSQSEDVALSDYQEELNNTSDALNVAVRMDSRVQKTGAP